MENPRRRNLVRYEMLKRMGYCVAESSEHFAEYVPWFIKSDRPDLIEKFQIPLDEYPTRCINHQKMWTDEKAALENSRVFEVKPSVEYASHIMNAIWMGDGMIPHIIFRQDDPDYFPGPSVWQTPPAKYPTGGISQPPVLSSIVLNLVEAATEKDLACASDMFDHLFRWHAWWHNARTPEGSNLIATVHPWKTGRDNCPDWTPGLRRMAVADDLPVYERRDTAHVDPSMRPSQEQYDKYVSIIMAGRRFNWDQKRLTTEGPFAMYDPGLIFILHRADKDLLTLARRFKRAQQAAVLQGWIDATEHDLEQIWNSDFRAFCARDIRSGEFSNGFSNASALCFYAGCGSHAQNLATLDHVYRISHKVGHLMPSWDPDHPEFERKRYWCGPVWPQMNYLLWKGFSESGQAYLVHRTQNDLARAIEASGFWECFDPTDGTGCVGTDFSWTAALWLAWLSPLRKSAAA